MRSVQRRCRTELAGIEAREAVTIGGSDAGTGNLISANAGPGVVLNGSDPAQSSTVRANTIGLDLAGMSPLGNNGSGIVIEAGPGASRPTQRSAAPAPAPAT